MNITLADYFGAHVRSSSAAELTDEKRAKASITVSRANLLLWKFGEARAVNSGWRPASYNVTVPGAALKSKHITCEAIDLADPDGDLDEWCMKNQDTLAEIGLWLEHPAATKGWCHVQIVPPKSGNRVFFP